MSKNDLMSKFMELMFVMGEKNTDNDKEHKEIIPEPVDNFFPAVENSQKDRDITLKKSFVPFQEAWRLTRTIDKMKKDMGKASQKTFDILIKVAYESFWLDCILDSAKEHLTKSGLGKEYQSIDLWSKRLKKLLNDNGIDYEDPTGCYLDEAQYEKIEVEKFISRAGVLHERVIETLHPIVYHKGKVIKRGVVYAETKTAG